MGLFSKEKISKEQVKKKDKWGSIQCKQANDICTAEINKRIKGAVLPGARIGHQSLVTISKFSVNKMV